MRKLSAMDESYSASRCCLGTGFIALEMRVHTFVSLGGGQIHTGDKVKKIIQDDDNQGRTEGRKKRWLIH